MTLLMLLSAYNMFHNFAKDYLKTIMQKVMHLKLQRPICSSWK